MRTSDLLTWRREVPSGAMFDGPDQTTDVASASVTVRLDAR